MILVIIAGGSGTRLWPLSTPEHPKHLLKINGSQNSLLQDTFERAKKLSDKVYVVSDISHIDHVKEQLQELDATHFITEPARRGTASCILLALAEISKANDPDEPVAFWPADHYVRDVAGFTHSFRVAEQTAKSQNRIVLVGAEPDYPATGLGYIEKDELLSEEAFVFNVKSFKEKPDFETAKSYLKSGNYLWNCGYFVGSVNTFKQTMKNHAPELYEEYEKLLGASSDEQEEIYLGFESVSIDYALMEKLANLLVVPASFDWMDLGSFGDLHKAVGSDEKGNYIQGSVETEGLTNSLVQNDEEKPVAVIGLDNVVVINTPQGVLVARKDLAQKVGDVSKRLNS